MFKETSRDFEDLRSEGITKDVAFNRKSFDNGEVRSPLDNGKVQVGTDGIVVELVQGIDEPAFRKTLSRTINATLGVDPDDPPDEADWEEMLQGGLQTALESQVIVFGVSGVSRACTHQLVRSRRAAFHQQSMRAHYYGDEPEFRMPESVWSKPAARDAFLEALSLAHQAYQIACQEDVSYQDARFILPEGTDNYITLEYPVKEFLAVYAYRACSMFQWEIVHVMRECKRVLVDAHPFMAPYVKISCELTHGTKDGLMLSEYKGGELTTMPDQDHTCTFQGWEEVDEQCDFPWARESNRQFKSKRHTIRRQNG